MINKYSLRELFVEVTNRCLLSCIHCSSCACAQASETLSLERLTKLIDDAHDMGLKSFTISGGEPFLYPHLTELINYIKSKDLSFNIYTCGILQDDNGKLVSLTDNLLASLLPLGPEKIIFSMHGSPTIHDQITGYEGAHELTVCSIDKAIKYGFQVELHCVPMTINLNDIDYVANFANQRGLKCLSLLRLVYQGRCLDSLVPTKEDYIELHHNVNNLKEKYPDLFIRRGTPFNCVTMSGSQCSAGKSKLLISASGEVFPCEAFKSRRGKQPIFDQQPLKDIWLGDILLNKVRDLNENGVPTCVGCEHYALCGGGCHGERMISTGFIEEGRDPLCLI